MTSSVPMFRESTGGSWSGDITPSIATLLGRLIFLTPVDGSYDPNAVFGKGTAEEQNRPNIRANVLVLDAAHLGLVGGELLFGGRGTPADPHTDRIGTPAFFQGVLVSNGSIVKELAAAEQERKDGKTGGWLMGIPVEGKGTKGNNPIHLGKIKVDQYGRARDNANDIYTLAEQQFTAYLSGALQLHTTSVLIPPTPQASPDAHKRYQERLTARANGQGAVSTPPSVTAAPYVPPTPAAVDTTPVPAAQPTQYAPGGVTAAQFTANAQAHPGIGVPAATTPSNPDDACPPGYDPAAWANVADPNLRAMIWTSVRSAQPVQPTH